MIIFLWINGNLILNAVSSSWCRGRPGEASQRTRRRCARGEPEPEKLKEN